MSATNESSLRWPPPLLLLLLLMLLAFGILSQAANTTSAQTADAKPNSLLTAIPTVTATATITCTAGGTPGPWAVRANYPQMFSDMGVASDGTTIYSFGGRNAGGRHNQAYKYNYAADSWMPIATVIAGATADLHAEYGHNGKIYVIGGSSNGTVNGIYDIASDSWALGAPAPAYVSWYGHAYWNGKIYVIGGVNASPSTDVYAYDIATDTWSNLAPLPQAENQMATAAINGKIYVANGRTDSVSVTNNLYIYDISTNTWSQGPSSPLASSAPASTVIGGKLYMIGGGTVLSANSGTSTSGAAQSSAEASTSTAPNHNSTYLYDPVTNIWSAGPSLNVARTRCDAATINTPGGQTVIVVGGLGSEPWTNSVEASTLLGVSCATVTNTPMPSATATVTCTPSGAWSIRQETVFGNLNSVAVVSANDVWAVGRYYPNSPGQTLIEHWDGSSWNIVPSPNPGLTRTLRGVAAVSANDVWAVGQYDPDGSSSATLIVHWDGSSWTIVPSPNLGSNASGLNAVVAVNSNDVWAMGDYGNGSPNYTLIEHWNGSTWSIVPSPNPGSDYNQLKGVAAVSANDIWAVGWCSNVTSAQTLGLTLHWNGSTWIIVPSPSPGSLNNRLNGVAAVSAQDVWAVGWIEGPSRSALIEHWNGSTWSLVPGPSEYNLHAVMARSANDIWAVGTASTTLIHAASMHWDGSAWSTMTVPDRGRIYNELEGVAAVSGQDVWAVGWDADDSDHTLIEHYLAVPCATVTSTPPANTPTRTYTALPTVTHGVPTSTSTNPPIPTPTLCPINFTDVHPTDYFYTPVQYLFCRGVISGYGNEFRPYNNTSRGQLCKIVVLGFNLTINTDGGPHFVDVPASNVFYPYIETAYNRGIVNGYGTKFRPNDSVTRGQLSKIVVLTAGWALRTPTTATFTDVPVGSTFFSYVETAYCHGIIAGYGSLFKPNDPATRGQISKIVYLALTSTAVCP